MVIQQVRCVNYNLYITGLVPISEWEGTIVYRTHKDGQINKFVEKYVKDTQRNNCVTTPTRFIPIDYLYNFVYNNVEVEGEYFKLQEVLIDNLEPETPLGGNFG